ncbi:MAG: copper amine oxidase N-terminal domain-containing protein, partial [Clostridiales bacterium]|nr:copper amine oxidase N-terminal domain-containing protein [Clostridiales bacterium]
SVSPFFNNGEAVIAVKEGRNGAVYLSGDTLFSLAEKAIPLTVKNGDTLVSIANNSIARELLEKAKGSNKGSVELKVDKLSKESQKDFFQRVDEDIMKGFTDVGGDIFEIGARIVYTDSEGIIENEDKIAAFFEPLKVTMPVPANISEEEAKKLTAIRYERDENGNIIPVKIGGKYDPVTKTITFYAEKGGSYGIMKAENLTRLNLQIDEQSVVIDDEEKSIDVPPMIINNRTMVPVRFISEALNAQVDWVPETRKVIITINNKVIELTIGEMSEGMDTPPVIMNDRTLVPVRYISEKLGANVLWIPSSRTVQIVN